jgi:hypothetical protein
MVEQIILSQCGITFDEEALERVGMPLSSFPIPQMPPVAEDPTCQSQLISDKAGPSTGSDDVVPLSVEEPSPVPPPTDSPTLPSPQDPETCDALAPMFDELQIQKVWWLLEILPLPFAYQDAHGKWHTKWR